MDMELVEKIWVNTNEAYMLINTSHFKTWKRRGAGVGG